MILVGSGCKLTYKMTDREKKRPVTAEEWAGYIFEYASKWEFGTPEHSAISDYLHLQRLYGQFEMREPLRIQEASGEAKMSKENREKLLIQRIALLQHSIELNESRVPGYASASMEISISFGTMVRTAEEEAEKKFPTSKAEQTEYIQGFYDHTLDDVSNCVWNKQDPDNFYA